MVKDHLGSPRVVFQDKNNNNQIDFATEIEEVKNYYPFGLEWDEPTQETAKYRNAYNNKERTPHTKYLDFGARNYIKSANVFDGPDPISSSFPQLTTINYAGNSPVAHIDLHGLQKVKLINGQILRGPNSPAVIDAANEQIAIDYIMSHPSTGGLGNVDEIVGNESVGGAMHEIFSPENVGAILMMAEGVSTPSRAGRTSLNVRAAGKADDATREGIIYERTDQTGALDKYVGQSKNEKRFLKRQGEHARANPDSDFEFKVIDRGDPRGKFPTDLDIKEQRALDARGGPRNKSNPQGGTSNKKNVIRKDRS